jgi:hypothetical protein
VCPFKVFVEQGNMIHNELSVCPYKVFVEQGNMLHNKLECLSLESFCVVR